jgi:hypothetical protein
MKKKTIGKRRIAAKARQVAGKIQAARVAQTGQTSRRRGHLSASVRRAQGRRDSR